MADGDEKRTRSADALEALAGGEGPGADAPPDAVAGDRPEHAEALANLAEGVSASQDPAPTVEEKAPPAGPVDLDVAASGTDDQRPSSAPVAGGNTRHLPKVMVPLLAVVGILLLVLSAAALVLLLVARPDNLDVSLLRKYGPMLVLVSCPLAAVLLGGSWWLHRQIRSERDG